MVLGRMDSVSPSSDTNGWIKDSLICKIKKLDSYPITNEETITELKGWVNGPEGKPGGDQIEKHLKQ
jgi:hypothetical protein